MKKSFTHFLNELNDGSTHAGLTADMGELLQSVRATGRTGSLTLTIKVAPPKNVRNGDVDRVTVTATAKLTTPKAEQPSDFFYLTDDGETTRNHPKQNSLELREVAAEPKPQQFKEA